MEGRSLFRQSPATDRSRTGGTLYAFLLGLRCRRCLLRLLALLHHFFGLVYRNAVLLGELLQLFLGQRLPRCQLPEQPPLLADVAVGGEGCLPQACFEGLSLLGAHDGFPFGWGRSVRHGI